MLKEQRNTKIILPPAAINISVDYERIKSYLLKENVYFEIMIVIAAFPGYRTNFATRKIFLLNLKNVLYNLY